jgi:hypothetical protein
MWVERWRWRSAVAVVVRQTKKKERAGSAMEKG